VSRETLRLRELESLDLGGIKLAAVGRVENDRLSDDGRIEAKPVVTADLATAGANVADRVDLETRRVVEAVVLDPLLGERRKPLALREPREFDPELVVLDGDGLHFAAVEIALALVLDLHLAALELCNRLRRQLHMHLLKYWITTIPSWWGLSIAVFDNT